MNTDPLCKFCYVASVGLSVGLSVKRRPWRAEVSYFVKIANCIDIPIAINVVSVNYCDQEGTRVKNTSASVPRIMALLGVKLMLVIAAPIQAFAWGPLGHKVTAEISFRNLTPAAKVKATELLDLRVPSSSPRFLGFSFRVPFQIARFQVQDPPTLRLTL